MKKNGCKIFLIILMSTAIFSCSVLNKVMEFENYVDSLEFKSGKYVVEMNDLNVLYLTVSPSDSFSYYKTSYSISDEKVLSFEECTNSYCIVRGLKEGSTTVSAEVGNVTAKCVVTVRKGSL